MHITTDARGRAVTHVSWLLAQLVLGEHVGRLLGGDPAAIAMAARGLKPSLPANGDSGH